MCGENGTGDEVREGLVSDSDLVEQEVSIFDEDGALTREFLSARGFCCGNGCRNCPYGFIDPSQPRP